MGDHRILTHLRLRIQIWRSSFVPRRVKFNVEIERLNAKPRSILYRRRNFNIKSGTNTNRPIAEPRSTLALLAVNRESSAVFHEHYTSWMNEEEARKGRLQRLYFNPEFDVLSRSAGHSTRDSMVLYKNYGDFLRHVQWYEITDLALSS